MKAKFTLSIRVFLTGTPDEDLVDANIKAARSIASDRLNQLTQGTSLEASRVKGTSEDGYLWATVRGVFSTGGFDEDDRPCPLDIAMTTTAQDVNDWFNPNGCDWFDFCDESLLVRGLSFEN